MQLPFSKREEIRELDTELIARIQPQLGISFRDEKYISAGDGYEAVIYVYGYRKNVGTHWLLTLMNISS